MTAAPLGAPSLHPNPAVGASALRSWRRRAHGGPQPHLVVAEILYVDRSRRPADPFCGSGAAELDVGAGEPIRPIDALYDIEGNDGIWSDGRLRCAPRRRVAAERPSSTEM